MTDRRRPVDLNLGDGPGATNLNRPLDLGQLTRELGKIPTPASTPKDTTLPSLDVLRATGSGSSVLRGTSPFVPPTDSSRPATPADTGRPAVTDTTRPATDTTRPASDATTRTTDASARVTDAAVKKPVKGVLELDYGDPNFDKAIAQKDYHTLKIKGLPEDVEIKPWLDKGGYFFWYKNGNDARAHHYFPPNLQTLKVEVWTGKHYKPYDKPVDEMRISALQSTMAGEKSGYSSFDSTTNSYAYARKMAGVADAALDLQEKALREGAEASPKNPYFRIYLADVLLARAIKPVLEDVKAGRDVKLDNPETIRKIDAAIEELQKAQEITRKYGDIRKGPNTRLQPPLSPFGLNPYYYNPDFYWSGAAYQAYQREVSLTAVRAIIKSGALKIELPPALPPR